MSIEKKILAVLRENPMGLTTTDIAKIVNISRLTATKYLEILKGKGLIHERKIGAYRIWIHRELLEDRKKIISRKLICALGDAIYRVFGEKSMEISFEIGRILSEHLVDLFKEGVISFHRGSFFEIISSYISLLSSGLKAEGIELAEGRGILRILVQEQCLREESIRMIGYLIGGVVSGLIENLLKMAAEISRPKIIKREAFFEVIVEVVFR
ncbi:MAG: winged helix-turn-helix transcriptional regulator [Candidatus Njordarchaeia archaeon]